jgi:hypothetical protein
MSSRSSPEIGDDGTAVEVCAAMSPDLIAALDRYIAGEQPTMTRPEALRAAFRDWATGRGLVESADEGLKPGELNASNDG